MVVKKKEGEEKKERTREGREGETGEEEVLCSPTHPSPFQIILLWYFIFFLGIQLFNVLVILNCSILCPLSDSLSNTRSSWPLSPTACCKC